ncbi:hypothetical protein FQN60_001434 [Etheostoma spectabile]|uniref:HEPN domain-containing protein n=1 Tax=Etheostoma spectabile TaxID=54343 RepID=A0A5J5D5L9_9PERO|nr:hypothetical protein FQN60_001434 [Etheostoma spectabile]
MGSDLLLVLAHLLMCDSLQDVQKYLANNGIRDSAEPKSFSRNPPAAGTQIPEEWLDSLDMNILNNFEEGEYVGYSTDNKFIYAVIVEKLPLHTGPYSQRYKIEIGEDEPIEVSCLDLYQFKRQKKPESKGRTCTSAEASCMELVPLAGAEPHSSKPSTTSSSSTRSSPASVDKAKREIDKCLADIWILPEEERLKAIKRLYLRWHPDKNLDCLLLATEAFKYLQNQISDLSKGKGKGKGKTAGSSNPNRNSNFSNFYQQWNQEAKHHRNGRERFSRDNHSYNFWTHNENVPKPNKEEAQRWCRQARCDLNAAHKEVGGASTEWCLFKIHQAVEKSLIAAKYKRDGQHPNSSSISALAAQVSLYNLQLTVLPQIVENLKMLGVDAKKTQYPNCHPFPHIPNERFKLENEILLSCDKPRGGERSHVVSYIYGVQLVGEESVSEVHALLLPSGVDGDDTGVDHHHHPYDEVVLLQHHVGDQGHQVQGLLLRALQLHNHHQQVGPREHRTGGREEVVVNTRREGRKEGVRAPQEAQVARPRPDSLSVAKAELGVEVVSMQRLLTVNGVVACGIPKVVLTARDESPKSLKIFEKD